MKTNRGILFKKMLAVMTVAAIMAAVGLLGLLPASVRGDEHSATRSFNPATVAPAGQVTVTIAAAKYGVAGGVTETLPPGFTYVSSSLDDDVDVTNLSGNRVRFTLFRVDSFTYVVTASDTAGSHRFSGTLRDFDLKDRAVGGDSSVTVRSPDEGTADSLSGVRVTADPDSPGAAAEYTITFKTEAVLRSGTDQIILDIDSSIGVPTSLAPSAVRIRASMIDGATDARPNQNRALDLAPVYRVIPGTDSRKEYKIRIPNMDAVPENPVADIAAGATVTLTLLANSGFTNPTEANLVVFKADGTRKSGGDDFKVSTSQRTEGVSAYISTPVQLFSDDKADNRDKPLTITGKGFKNGTSATVYLDRNKNGMKDAGDVDLVSVPVASDDTFEATFNVTVPPFKAGKGNMINAVDGETPPNTAEMGSPLRGRGSLVRVARDPRGWRYAVDRPQGLAQ